MGRFDGRVAVVTGASRGFGRATALGFAREGAKVVANYHQSRDAALRLKEEIEEMGSRVLLVQGDVGIREDCKRIVSEAEHCFGRVDILVNNAGIMDVTEFVSQDEATWDAMMAVNVFGVLHTTRAALPLMIRQRYGKIVNLTSQLAYISMERFAVYAGTKGFVVSMTRNLAREVGQHGINVNAVAPGFIVTDMNRFLYPTPEALQARAAQLPLRRFGTEEDVANCVLFLCSEEANFLTGQVLHPSGGNVMA